MNQLAVLSLVGMSCFGGEVVSAGLAPGSPRTTYRVTANGKPVAIYRSMADDEYRQDTRSRTTIWFLTFRGMRVEARPHRFR